MSGMACRLFCESMHNNYQHSVHFHLYASLTIRQVRFLLNNKGGNPAFTTRFHGRGTGVMN